MSDDDDDDDVWAQFRTDASVLAVRAQTEARLAEVLRTAAAETTYARRPARPAPAMRSLVLSVAQYYSDNARDEVHYWITGTTGAGDPAWPHACLDLGETGQVPAAFEGCSRCVLQFRHHDFGYGPLIPAYEAFCSEGANQDMDPDESHRPLLRVGFDDAGRVVTERVGHLVRPWLDAWQTPLEALPEISERALAAIDHLDVLRDALLEANDPRGEWLATRPAHAARAFLGAFDRHVPRSGLASVGGVPTEIELDLDVDADLDREARLPWAFAPRVRFLGRADIVPWPALAPVRALANVFATGFDALVYGDTVYPNLEQLEVTVEPAALVDLAATPNLPRLRRLVVFDGTAGVIPHVAHLRLEHLEITCRPEEYDAMLVALRAANVPYPVTLSTHDVPTWRPWRWGRRERVSRTTSG